MTGERLRGIGYDPSAPKIEFLLSRYWTEGYASQGDHERGDLLVLARLDQIPTPSLLLSFLLHVGSRVFDSFYLLSFELWQRSSDSRLASFSRLGHGIVQLFWLSRRHRG